MGEWLTAHAAMRYIMLAKQSGDREVGGYAKFHIDEHGNVIVTELRPVRQQSSECYFEIDEKENALFLEQLVSEGEDPADWSMLFHTHPEGMDAQMSGTDVKQITEMAKDLPGTIVRSMILGQGKMLPMIHEAVCVDGKVFLREDVRMQILDTTGATDDLKKIGFFDKPKVVTPIKSRQTGFTSTYAAGVERSTSLVSTFRERADRAFSANDGWYDESPISSEAPMETAEYSSWLDDKWIADADLKDEADDFIGTVVMHQGHQVVVIDAYVWDGDVVLVLPDNTEILLDDATLVQQEKQGA